MEIIPAIDLKDGCCVRLVKGEFSKETVYSRKPIQMARYWQQQGATRLHLVDLDGARDGKPQNLEIIREIVNSLEIPVQLGGGIRSKEIIDLYLLAGIDRVILGTIAQQNPSLVGKAIQEYGSDRIVVGVDGRDGRVAVKGWVEDTEQTVEELILEMKSLGVKTFIYTDISRDGTLVGPDLEGLKKLSRIEGIEVIASGGVSSLNDLLALQGIGIRQAIVGRALYTGDIKPDLRKLVQIINNG
jgi:phosphoribosylformimino-5-aminoimidazole carboxamide ribotide isomerase